MDSVVGVAQQGTDGSREELQFTAGQFKEPFSQEELRGDAFQDFVERSLVNNLSPSRSPGINFSFNLTYASTRESETFPVHLVWSVAREAQRKYQGEDLTLHEVHVNSLLILNVATSWFSTAESEYRAYDVQIPILSQVVKVQG